jgi:hypothetical protein
MYSCTHSNCRQISIAHKTGFPTQVACELCESRCSAISPLRSGLWSGLKHMSVHRFLGRETTCRVSTSTVQSIAIDTMAKLAAKWGRGLVPHGAGGATAPDVIKQSSAPPQRSCGDTCWWIISGGLGSPVCGRGRPLFKSTTSAMASVKEGPDEDVSPVAPAWEVENRDFPTGYAAMHRQTSEIGGAAGRRTGFGIANRRP